MLFTRLLVLGLSTQLLPADILPKPDRIAAPPTAEQAALIREGVALHDRQDYGGAIRNYKLVLAQNPWEVNALSELAFTYFESKRYEDALSTARLGAQCKSEALPRLYLTIGNALDELGKPKDAIETFKAALKKHPQFGLLHYNLAISLSRAGKAKEARAEIQSALACDPGHASSHAALGEIYRAMGYRIPAVLAYSRLLTLQPASPRSLQILPVLQDLLTKGVGKGQKPNEINILVSETPKERMDEGDFSAVEMTMSILLAADLITTPEKANEKPSSPFEKLVSLYSSIGESLENARPKRGFAATYYAPYFASLVKAGHAEAFVATAWQAGNVAGAADWVKANEARIQAFQSWSAAYRWPAK